jgi:hypothetical protein
MIKDKIIRTLLVTPGKRVRLNNFPTGWATREELNEAGKDAVKERDSDLLDASRASLSSAEIIATKIDGLHLHYAEVSVEQMGLIEKAREQLMQE